MKPEYMDVMVTVRVAIPESAHRWEMERKAEAIALDITVQIEDEYEVVDWDNVYRGEDEDIVEWEE